MRIRRISVFALLIISSVVLTSCAPAVGAEAQPKGTSNAAATRPPYPGLNSETPPPHPTQADRTPDQDKGLWVTPLPNEKVGLGNVVETNAVPLPTSVPPRYTFRNEFVGQGNEARFALFVHDTQLNTEVRLGTDDGDASFGVMNDEYVIWRFRCYACKEDTALKTGLYAYTLASGEQLLITAGAGSHPKIDRGWVIYTDAQDPNQMVSNLYAHNLITNEELVVSKDVVHPWVGLAMGSPNPSDYYMIRDTKIAWVASAPLGKKWGMGMYDLATQAARPLTIPGVLLPRDWDFFGDILLWRDGFWQGYDLQQDAYFTIPVIPPGWENVPLQGVSLVTAKGNALYWSLTVDDETHYFTAPIVPKGAQPTHLVPTPHRKLTLVAPTPTPVAVSTAYP
jgi:hypothetical protein